MFKETPIYDELTAEIQSRKDTADRESAAALRDPDTDNSPDTAKPKKKAKRKPNK